MPKLEVADRFIAYLILQRRTADRDDPLTAAEIAQITGLSIAEVDRRIERMEDAGVIGLSGRSRRRRYRRPASFRAANGDEPWAFERPGLS
jgi:CRP-like cAMP-binding protein